MSADSMVIECPCGVVLRGENEPGVVAAARQHARQTHDMDLSEDQAREMARPA